MSNKWLATTEMIGDHQHVGCKTYLTPTSLHLSGRYVIVIPYPPGRGKGTNESSWVKSLSNHKMFNDQGYLREWSGMRKFGNKMTLLLR